MEHARVVIISDDPLTRSGLAALLNTTSEVAVVATSRSRAEELERANADVALVDVGGSRESLPEVAAVLPVVALVADEAQAADALAGGARGAVFRNASAEQLGAALLAVHRGLVVVDGTLDAWVHPPSPPVTADAEPGLTPREAQVLALLAQGLSNKGIAQRLGITDRTAKFHVESILAKLGAGSRSEAIVIAARRGLVTL